MSASLHRFAYLQKLLAALHAIGHHQVSLHSNAHTLPVLPMSCPTRSTGGPLSAVVRVHTVVLGSSVLQRQAQACITVSNTPTSLPGLHSPTTTKQ